MTLAAVAAAQSPAAESSPAKAAEVVLQSLDALANAGIHSVQSLRADAPGSVPGNPQDPPPQAGTDVRQGTSAVRLWARVRDARFHRDGHLLAMLVEPPTVDPRGVDPLRVLPAAAVRWDASRRLWILNEPNLQFAELAAAGEPKPAAAPAPVPVARQEEFLASQLVRTTIEPLPAGAAPPEGRVEAPGVAKEAPRAATPPSYWFAPGAQRLAFAVVPVEILTADGKRAVKHVPLPWSAVRLAADGGRLQVTLAAQPEQLRSAPDCTNPADPALFLQRHRAYAHFGVAVPGWDPAPQAPAQPGK